MSIQFDATTHHFGEDDLSGISYQPISWKINTGQSITIRGTALTTLQNRIITEEPTKTFGTFYFNENNIRTTISTGTPLNRVIVFNTPGVYIVEVNNIGGGAVINRPVYVGNSYPLLPDFEDLNPQILTREEIASAMPSDINSQRNILANLLSQKRA